MRKQNNPEAALYGRITEDPTTAEIVVRCAENPIVLLRWLLTYVAIEPRLESSLYLV